MKYLLILLSFFVVLLISTPQAFANNLFANPTFSTDLSGWDTGETPLDVTGLQVWLKADAITNTNDGTAISNWSDSSGNNFNASQSANNLQPTYKSSIINNKPVVRFNGTGYMQLPPSSVGLSNNVSGITIFTIASSKTTSNARVISIQTPAGTDRATAGRTSSGAFNALGRALDNDTVQIATGGAYTTSTFYVNDSIFDYIDGLLSIYKNGTVAVSSSAFQSSTTTSATNSKNIYVGSDGTTGFNGDIAEAVIFNQTLAQIDRQNIEAYLANRYGLSLSSTLITATRDTSRKYNNNPSAKIVTSSTSNFTQTITTGDTNTYTLSMYAYTNGNAITSSDAQLFAGGNIQNTTYSSVGQGWYLLNATVTGSTSPADYGIQVYGNKTIYLNFMTLSIQNEPPVDLGGDIDPNSLPGWKLPIMAGPNFAGNEAYISNGLVPGISLYIANTAPHDDINITFSKSDPHAFYVVGGKTLSPPQLDGFHVVSDLYGATASAAFNGYPEAATDGPYTILLNYYRDRIPNGYDTSDLTMIVFNPDANQWEQLDTPNVVNPIRSTIANTTTDFGYFAVAIADYFPQNKVMGTQTSINTPVLQKLPPSLLPPKPPLQSKKPEQIPTILPANNINSKKRFCIIGFCF